MLAGTTETSEALCAELERIKQLMSDLTALLSTQRDILRQRGISLPPGVLSGLQAAERTLNDLITEASESEGELAQLRAVAETTALINSTLELDEVLGTVMDTVIQLTGAERGYIMLNNETDSGMSFHIGRGMDSQVLDRSDMTVSRTIIGRAAESGEPVLTTNAQEDTRFSSQESVVGFSLRSILCVPLKVRGEVIGVAYADNRIKSGLFGEREKDLLMAFANQAAVAIQNARLFESVKRSLAEITELKELLDNVFDSIVSGVITTDLSDLVTMCNRAAQEILAVQPEQSTGVPLQTVLPLDSDFAGLLGDVQDRGHQEILEVEPEIPSRGTVNLNLRLSPLEDAEDTIQGVAIVMDDLTELRRQEAQLEAVRRYLPPAMVDNIQSIEALALGGVRREITVMYVNVVPFEVLFSQHDTATFMALINRYLTVATDVIHDHEGVVDKYMGADVMCLFNTQLNPTPDHAWRAVRAAAEVSRGLARLQNELGDEQLYCRIGIHSGPATVGNVGSLSRREFTAIGDTVNLAHRLLENAALGQTIISEDTYGLCQETFEGSSHPFDILQRGAIRVKGRQQLTEIYEVRSI